MFMVILAQNFVKSRANPLSSGITLTFAQTSVKTDRLKNATRIETTGERGGRNSAP
jgi:hypothetical protein